MATEATGSRAVRMLMMGTVAILFLYSLHLAINRIIQVDEAQNLYMARIIGSGQTDTYFVHPALFLLGPLAWIAESASTAKEVFVSGRLLFAGVFWLNIVLMVKCTGTSLRTREGLLATLVAATLAPLWDYGFEIRHDNLLLTGLLLIWLLGRYRGDATSSYFAIGVLTATLQFVAFKAFVFTLPISVYLLLCRAETQRTILTKAIAAWAGGIVLAGVACLLIYSSLGLLGEFLGNTATLGRSRHSSARFLPFDTLSRLLFQTPLLVAVATAALALAALAAMRMPKALLEQDGLMPEAVLLSIALGALFINPTPFPYNLITVVPFAFLLAFRFARQMLQRWTPDRSLVALAVSIFAFSHLTPFVQATLRHLNWNNWRQMELIAAAEAMTDPASDPVYDAAGLVLTRHSIDRSWYLHSLNMRRLYEDHQSPVAGMLERNPAAVLMPNYRFDWLAEADWQFIRAHYLPLANDFWLLGTQLPPGGGEFRTLRSGRYQILAGADATHEARRELTVDNRPVSSDIVTLVAGSHTVNAPSKVQVTIVWLGPKLDTLPAIGVGNHRTLFRNWY